MDRVEPAVVFVPGFMQRADAWAPVAGRVGQRYRSIVAEHRAYSREGRLEEIAELAPAGSALAGYSMGGRLALHAALAEPERYAGLVLVSANAGIADDGERTRRRHADEDLAAWMEERGIDEVVERWEAQPVFATQSPELAAAQRPGRLSHDPVALASLLRSAGQGAMEPVWDQLGRLEVPTLLLAGEEDRVYARVAGRMAEEMPAARAALVPGAGHAAHLEAPEVVAALILDFLATVAFEGP